MRRAEVRIDRAAGRISKRWVARVVERALEAEKVRAGDVSVLVTGNRQIKALNKKYLNHNYATDVIAFGLGAPLLGDVVVSVEMARSVSRRLGVPFREELARYLVHGVLHLLGYQDKKVKDRKRMFGRQEWILTKVLSTSECRMIRRVAAAGPPALRAVGSERRAPSRPQPRACRGARTEWGEPRTGPAESGRSVI